MPSIIETIHALDLPDVKSATGEVKYAVRMKYRRASEVAEILSRPAYLSPVGVVSADDFSNTLFISDTVAEGVGDLAFLEYYDVPAPQVNFDVQIVEIREDATEKIGTTQFPEPEYSHAHPRIEQREQIVAIENPIPIRVLLKRIRPHFNFIGV